MKQFKHRLILNAKQIASSIDEATSSLRGILGNEEITAVPIMGGAMIFAADLVRRLPDTMIIDFMSIQTYGDATSPQSAPKVSWIPKKENIENRHILLIDDILDTGRTMLFAREFLLNEMGASRVTIVVLINKSVRRVVNIEPDISIIDIEDDLFLVGFGLDYQGRYRNIPDLFALELGSDGMPIFLK